MLLQFKSRHHNTPIYININKIIALQEEKVNGDFYTRIYTQDGDDSYFTVEGKVEDIALRINNYESHRLPVPESTFESALKALVIHVKNIAEVIKRK